MPSIAFRQTEAGESTQIRKFLASVFGTGLDAPSLEPDLIRWKYYDDRPGWSGSRSYVLERGGSYAAHGCVWPMRLGGTEACQIIDWAAAPTAAGTGLLLRREVEKLIPVSVGIGGSEDTRKVLPRGGYQTVAQYRKFVRVLRPLRQFGARTERALWLKAAKTARAWLWCLSPMPRIAGGWSVEPVTRFRAEDLPHPAIRTAELLNYLLACPAVRVRGCVLRNDGRIIGHVLVSEVDGQARIADLQLASREPADWAASTALATRFAAQNRGNFEVVAHSCLGAFSAALERVGYRERGEQPVFVKGVEHLISGEPLHITPADYDDFFSIYRDQPFAT